MSDSDEPRYPYLVVDVKPDELDVMVGRLTLLGAEGIEERDATTLSRGGALGVTLVASFPTHELAHAAVAEIGVGARVEEVVGDGWRDAWKAHWKPTRLGRRIVVVPSWVEYTAEPDDVVMRLDPGGAFGTGQHASTALAAASLERMIDAGARGPLLDIGCGSGILSFCALLLGIERAIGCDTDPEAVAAARENADALGLGARATFRTGPLDVVTETSSLVVANIEAVVLIPLAPQLATRVAPGGVLILSGILSSQLSAVDAAYARAGLAPVGHEERDGWVAPRYARAT